jgi:cytochrome c-type biogenesis protein CcmH
MKVRILILLSALVSTVPPLPAPDAQDIEKGYKEVGAQLTCQCGCREQITKCGMQNCGSATPIRAEIREKLKAGMGVEQIVDSFVARMGKQVLAAPPMKGFDLTAWIVPFMMLGLGLVLVGWIVVKMRHPVAQVEAITAAQDARVNSELRDFEEES